MAASSGSLLHGVAEALGASEAALRLILSIFIGYPLALFHRHFLFKKQPSHIHLFNTVTGLCIAYFNFGSQLYHSLLCVVLHFLILRLMGRTVTAVLTGFCFQMGYLLFGYYYTATDNYDIKWTMPHCVLTLKLIGLAFDYYDGGKAKDPKQGCQDSSQDPTCKREETSLTAEQQRYAVQGVPTLMEVCGFSYYYGGFLVGPQFSMGMYLSLVKGELSDVEGQVPNSVIPAMKRLCLGLFFLTVYTVFGPYLPDSYFLTEEYANQPFWYRCVYMTIWGKVMLYKYVTCWLVTEGVCILSGLGYNGKDEKGEPRWDACANMKVWQFETTPLFTGTIASFNINTNDWVARYVFKRLRFLGNKFISQAAALFFLAIWHGLHSGYLICFSLEFLIVVVEKQAIELVRDSPLLSQISSMPVLRPPLYVVQQTLHWLFMGYPLVPFCLFTWDKWLKVYTSVYFIGHLFFLLLLFALPYLRLVLVQKKDKLQKSH